MKDTLVVPPVAIMDTVTMKQHDTITLIKEKLKVQLVKVNDTITINAICDSDTIVRTIEVPYEKIVYVEQKTFWQKVQSILLYIALGLVGLFICKKLIEKYI